MVLEKDGDQLNMCVKNEEVLHRVQVETNILQTIRGRKPIWIGHILHRNCLLKHVIEEKMIDITGRQGRSVVIHREGIRTINNKED